MAGRYTYDNQTFRIKLYINGVLVTQYEAEYENNNPPSSLPHYHTADLKYGDTIRMDGYCSHAYKYTFEVSSGFRKPDTSSFFD